MLGGPVIGVWASISRHRDGALEQLDPDGEKNLFNSRQPADDVANYLEPWSAILQNAGGYSPEAARAAALEVLPDILHYDRTKPVTYPNGRVPTDDVYSLRFAWLSNGKIPPSGLKPHDGQNAPSHSGRQKPRDDGPENASWPNQRRDKCEQR
jgi:hypothetical protein